MGMKARGSVVGGAIALAVALLLACAFLGGPTGEKPTDDRVYTVGIVNIVEQLEPLINECKRGLSDAGFVEGKNVRYIYRGHVRVPQIEEALQELIDAKADVIITIATPETIKAKEMTKGTGTPILFGAVSHPRKSGIVQDFARPEGNVTGVRMGNNTPLAFKWATRVAPNVKAVLVPHKPADKNSVVEIANLTQTAKALGVKIVVAEVPSAADEAELFSNPARGAQAIVFPPIGSMKHPFNEVIDWAIREKLPLVVSRRQQVERGALMSFGPEAPAMGRQLSRMVVRVLQGEPPSRLPVETAEFFLTVNLQTAKEIDLKVSPAVLQQVDRIVRVTKRKAAH